MTSLLEASIGPHALQRISWTGSSLRNRLTQHGAADPEGRHFQAAMQAQLEKISKFYRAKELQLEARHRSVKMRRPHCH